MIRMCISIRPTERTNERALLCLPPRIIYSWDLVCAIDSLSPAPDRSSASPRIFGEARVTQADLCRRSVGQNPERASEEGGERDHRRRS